MSNYNDLFKSFAPDRQEAFAKLIEVIRENIPKEFEESVSTMVNYTVPLKTYPDGYHCTANTPLPFANVANQKNFIALYHMGLYSDKKLLEWFQQEYANQCKYKLNMGKSCIRFKYLNDIPYELIGELMSKVTVQDWIATYESAIKKSD